MATGGRVSPELAAESWRSAEFSASRRLLKGPPEELIARIDEEAELFKVRLKSAEARAAFEKFLSKGK